MAASVLIKGKEDPYPVASILSWLSELGHSKVINQSDGEPASEVVMCTVQAKGAMMANHHVRSSSNEHGGTATRATVNRTNGTNETHSKQSLQDSKASRRTQESLSKFTVLGSHGHHDTQHGSTRQDSTTRAYEKFRLMSYQNPILLVGEAVACRRFGALLNKLESAWLESIWLGRDSKTDEHLSSTRTSPTANRRANC